MQSVGCHLRKAFQADRQTGQGGPLSVELWGWWRTNDDHREFTKGADARRYFGASQVGWSELLHLMGDFENIKTVKCRKLLDKLSKGDNNTWRLQQVAERLKLAKAHRAALTETEWTPKRIAAAKAFIAAKERLYRNVWRLGLQRHSFRFENNMPGWHESFIKMSGGKIKSDAIEQT